MLVGVTPTTLEDNLMGARGSLPGEPPSQQLQDSPGAIGVGHRKGLWAM